MKTGARQSIPAKLTRSDRVIRILSPSVWMLIKDMKKNIDASVREKLFRSASFIGPY
jgi:hypothetical protein